MPNGLERFLIMESDDAEEVMGWPDNLNQKSSMTLFSLATLECEVFQKVLDKFFRRERNQKTVKILQGKDETISMHQKQVDFKAFGI